MRMKGNPLFILFASLAIVGLVSQLMFNTQGFLTNLLVTVLVVALFIALYTYLTRRSQASVHQRQASVRRGQAPKRLEHHRLPRQRKREHSFKVIEGNKGKKNRPHSS